MGVSERPGWRGAGAAGRGGPPGRGHAGLPRGLGSVPGSPLHEGRFGRMFRRLPPFTPDEAFIEALVRTMVERSGDPGGDNEAIPAGYTYLGQFVDHDLTFDPQSSLDRQNDPDALVSFRSPRFDLDSLYGRGPDDQPYLYDRRGTGAFLVGGHDGERDLPRNPWETAIIGDPRNDENVFVSQIHLTMMLFHNKVLERLHEFPKAAPRAGETPFDAARRTVRHHYQWIVVHDFLRRVVGGRTFGSVLRREPLVPGGEPVEKADLRLFRWRNAPFIPVEFSGAAYRFGHSMVRGGYRLNTTVPPLPTFTPEPVGENPLGHFGGFRKLPPQWQVEWPRFFDLGGDPAELQPSRRIDTGIAPPLHALPPEVAPGMSSLIRRNLTRGARLGLPSGQAVAGAMGVRPLTDGELALPEPGPAPLWYYVLREARCLHGGRHLGPVGGRIVAEVLLGLLHADPSSYPAMEPGWLPFLPSAHEGEFTMSDLIRFTGFGLTPV